MTHETKKNNLIIALQNEKHLFAKGNHDTLHHFQAIHFLETNEIEGNTDENKLLDACINDFEFIYNDYC
jgi:hypothetical protein